MKETIILALKLHIKNKVEMSVKNQKTILKYINKQDKEIERLHNIIKEVREEIQFIDIESYLIKHEDLKKLLEILERADNDNKR